MKSAQWLLALSLPVLATACVPVQDLSSDRGIAYRVADDSDALEEAVLRADNHCEDYGRSAVLQSVNDTDDGELLATFDCASGEGGGIAVWVDEDDSDGVIIGDDEDELDDAVAQADEYCDDYDRIAVLQSVGTVDNDRIAAFNCVRS